ncbi:MAG: hypothetical protein A2Y62_06050, partial [Candidatus Fischerbacteria bacterium RBG_13_37_8]
MLRSDPLNKKMTERMYHRDSYVTECEANIIQKKTVKNTVEVILNRTCFYPFAGGQESDRGVIGGKNVIEVREEGDAIIHVLDGEPEQTSVHCAIDWRRRYDFMQQHTGQHILSRCFLELEDAPTISAHMGETRNTVDLKVAILDWERIVKVEEYANEIIRKALPVSIHFFDKREDCPFDLRKEPVVEGIVRIIKMQDFEATPCGGTHCMNSVEVGLIKVTDYQKYKGGYRVEFLCGGRAYGDYHDKVVLLAVLRNELSAKEEELVQVAVRIRESEKSLKRELGSAWRNYLKLQAEQIIAEYMHSPSVVLKKKFHDYGIEKLIQLAGMLTCKVAVPVVLIGLGEEIAVVISAAKESGAKLKESCMPVLQNYAWRGGGSDT